MRTTTLIFLLTLAAPLALFAEPAGTTNEAGTDTMVAKPGQIADKPQQYIGHKVEIQDAEIEKVHAQRVFTLDGGLIDTDPDVAVIIPKLAARARISEDARVDVTGVVRRFSAEEIKRDYPWFKVASGIESDLEGRPVVIAESVKTPDGRELVADASDGTETEKEPARTDEIEAPRQY